MLKVKVISDLHLEILSPESIRYTAARVAKQPADVLVVAGDLCPIKTKRWKQFFTELQMHFRHIIWVPGNHEYYGTNFQMGPIYHRNRLDRFSQDQPIGAADIHYLDNGRITIDNVNFVGSTLWTDFEKRNPLVMNDCQRLMNDFYRIKYDGRRMITNDQYALHQKAKGYLSDALRIGSKQGNTNFVVTHHGPTLLSVHGDYKSAQWAITNGAYVSDLSEFILDREIAFWVHGHTHRNFDYEVGDTRVIVNPHGYQNENFNDFDPNLILEIDNEKD